MSINSLRKIDQKEYLKKYLSGDKVKKKKKDKKHKKSSASSSVKVKIIDDDVNHLDTGLHIDEELLLTGDDAPQIVGEYIEENPGESKLPKWRSIGIKEEIQDEYTSNARCEADLNTKNDFSPQRRRRHNSLSPPRKDKWDKSPIRNKIKREPITPDKSPPRRRPVRENDFSPSKEEFSPKNDRRKNKDRFLPRHRKSSTDLTPPKNKKSYDPLSKRGREDFDQSPIRKVNDHSPDATQHRRRQNSDQTLHRKRRSCSSGQSPPRRDRKIRNSDQSPLRRGTDLSPDQSPLRKGGNHLPEKSPPRRRRNSDQSPPRKVKNRSHDQSPRRNRRSADQSPPQKRKNHSPEQSPSRRRRNSDQSPPRKGRNHSPDKSPTRNRRSVDQSPPRKRINRSPEQSPPRRRKADNSPPRKYRNSSQGEHKIYSPPRSSRNDSAKYIKREKLSPELSPALSRRSRWERQESERSLSPPPTHKPKPGKTLEGKKAGLQNAQDLHKESLERRKQENLLFEKMSSDISGRHAEVQVRSTGRKGRRAREALEEDPQERKRKEEHDEKKKQLYDRWGKGLKQIEDHKNRLLEQAHESSKPLARYEDDEDLERHLKEQERAEDPMLEYMRQKRKEKEKQSGKPQIPRYEGSFPENRFGIRPGYRWDGVDRSNGYEKKYFSVQNEKRARQDEAYKYSVEDM